jgi:hypothetical protein
MSSSSPPATPLGHRGFIPQFFTAARSRKAVAVRGMIKGGSIAPE